MGLFKKKTPLEYAKVRREELILAMIDTNSYAYAGMLQDQIDRVDGIIKKLEDEEAAKRVSGTTGTGRNS